MNYETILINFRKANRHLHYHLVVMLDYYLYSADAECQLEIGVVPVADIQVVVALVE